MDDAILITGGAGLIGSRLCEYFYKEGFPEVKEVCGSQSEIKFKPLQGDGLLLRRPDITRTVKILGWQPKVSRSDVLKKALEYFRGLVTVSHA